MSARRDRVDRAVKRTIAVYGGLMRVLPKAFRKAEGDELLRTFEHVSRRCVERSGFAAVWWLTAVESADLLRAAVVMRWKQSGMGSGSSVPRVGEAEGGGQGGVGRGGRVRAFGAGPGQAFRHLRAQPGFSIVFMLTFALGVGVNAALFTLVSNVAIRSPYPGAGRLTEVWTLDEDTGRDGPAITAATFLEWRGFTDVFDGLEGSSGPSSRALTGAGHPERIATATVTPGLFGLLGVRPRLGRTFEGSEGAVGGRPVVVIGDALWARRFGRDRGVLGRTMEFDGVAWEVVGVMPAGFGYPYGDTEAWFPLATTPSALESAGRLGATARLRAGMTIEAASELSKRDAERALAGRSATSHVVPYLIGLEFMSTPERTKSGLLMLFGGVVMVLAIAAANVLGLALANGLRRKRELAVRAALGAGRGSILIQLCCESLMLTAAGGVIGLLMAQAMIAGLVPHVPARLGINTGVHAFSLWPDGVAFVVVATLVVGTVTGVLPALMLGTGRTLAAGIESRTTQDRHGLKVQRGLIVTEVAFSVVLLIAGGLLFNSFARLSYRDPVVAADRLLLVTLTLGPDARADAARIARFETFSDALGRVEDVTAVATTVSRLPWISGAQFNPVLESAAGVRLAMDDDFLPYNQVSPGFLETAGIAVREGRTLLPEDEGGSNVVINEIMARRLWPAGSAIGSTFRVDEDEPWLTVVGVAVDVPQGPRDNIGDGMEYYVPLPLRRVRAERTFVLRTRGSPAAAADAARRAIWSVDPDQPIDRLVPYEQALGETMAGDRFYLSLVSLFAVLATGLCVIGLHAVLSQVLNRRSRELGIRVALGAGRASLLRLAMGDGLLMVAAGIGIGVLIAGAVTRFLDRMLFGIGATDPLTFAVLSALMLLVGLTASWLPARRAVAHDPARIMRES